MLQDKIYTTKHGHTSSSLVSPTNVVRLMTVLLALAVIVGHTIRGPTHMFAAAIVMLAYAAVAELLIKKLNTEIVELKEFHTICAWCKKVHYEDRYITVEEYLKVKTATETSHGICEDCRNNLLH